MKNRDWIEYVLKHTRADFDTGEIFWAVPMKGRRVGKPLGCLDSNGYIKCQVDGVATYAHTLIWIHAHQEIPAMLDHINQRRADNRLRNLRPTNHSANMLNRYVTSANQSGVRGVYPVASGRYKIQIAGRYLGTVDTIEEARGIVENEKV